MKCQLVEQGYKPGNCSIIFNDEQRRACEVTIKHERNQWSRLIKSAHLSRPEHYFSIYQSGCNHSCLKCHSWEFSQKADGNWVSTEAICEMAKKYEKEVTVFEERGRATMWHATDLCRSCGSCIIHGKKGNLCPDVLNPGDLVLSPQGIGPARNIIAFTGGDLSCCVEFYCQAAKKIKRECENMLVLLETNGLGMTPRNLDQLKEAGVDSFWLDIKAFDEEIYRKLCGTTNEWILKAPMEIAKRGFVLEVLTLFIPGWVENDQIARIARFLLEINPDIPLTILAFFPAYKMQNIRSPSLSEMVSVYHRVKEMGLRKVKLGNCGVFAMSEKDWKYLLKEVKKESIG